ncbi:hypothetical protein GCM10023156_35810 [Novipirellula rosea]|uniref:Uncharacterized protein n=1 Tax=Novipirellula rosea TaxID=1031540 RepID=A0ABP8N1U2_9BACT
MEGKRDDGRYGATDLTDFVDDEETCDDCCDRFDTHLNPPGTSRVRRRSKGKKQNYKPAELSADRYLGEQYPRQERKSS